MHSLPRHRRIALLTEGHLGVFSSKTAAVLLRYRPQDVLAVVDSTAAGRDIREVIPWSPPVPIAGRVDELQGLGPDSLYVGIAPVGGALTEDLRRHVRDALHAGMDVVSGLHFFLEDDPELSTIARHSGSKIFDVRRPVGERVVASGRAAATHCRRVLTVGTDCNVGKMVTALELAEAARRAGRDARFLATGQTGIMIAGRGVAVDACVADFAAGAVEELVLDAGSADICFVEGQGSLAHPGFSAVTLALLHGACPDALVLVHALGRTNYNAPPHAPLPPIPRLIEFYERAAGFLHAARVVGIALNTVGYSAEDAAGARQRLSEELQRPVADPVRDGCEPLVRAVLES